MRIVSQSISIKRIKKGTTLFQASPILDKNRILNTILIELTKKDINGIIQPQKGVNAGC